ncbi:ABC-type nitrate/sulfonate/bicarbonate transport system ATPase subunit [Bradyrhizobium sp. LB14.3]
MLLATRPQVNNEGEETVDQPIAPYAREEDGCQRTMPLWNFLGFRRPTTAKSWSLRTSIWISLGGEFLTMLAICLRQDDYRDDACRLRGAHLWLGPAGGRSISNMPPRKRDIGMVFQYYALFPHMTVEENLAFPLKVRKLGKLEREAKIKRALDMVRLGAYGGRRPGPLSGGQQQRVALARALVFDPKLVLMDEPLGALDKQLREHMQLEIKHIHEDLGVTMVYVTHDQGEALTMSDRIAVFDDGVIQQLAAPAELYERPQSLRRPIHWREQPTDWQYGGDKRRELRCGDSGRRQCAGARR